MKVRKLLSITMVAAMLIGSSMTAFAEGQETSGSATGEGTGASNGHVDKKVVSVTLPTSIGTTFDYIADPEDLVGQTQPADGTKGKTKDGTEVVPNDSYVYFYNAAVTADADAGIDAVVEGYSNTSNTVRVANKSSVAINLTVTAAVVDNDNNMAIADTAAELSDATDTPTLHFDLKTKLKGADAFTDTPVENTDDGALAKIENIELAGTEDNFELTQSGTGAEGKYVYDLKDSVKDKDWVWVDIALSGACSASTSSDTLVAPSFEFTWSWKDPSATAAPSIATKTYAMTAGTDVEVTVNLGLGELAATGVEAVIWNGNNLLGNTVSYADGKVTIGKASIDFLIGSPTQPRKMTVRFNDTAKTEVEITFTAD